MPDLEYWSSDRRFGALLNEEVMSKVRAFCTRANGLETAGILVGIYNKRHDCAVVMDASDAPPDTRRGRTWVHRGVRGLQEWLNRLWNSQRRFYVGEWHFHPDHDPTPSGDDLRQMRLIAAAEDYRCPEPLLLIIGGNALGWRVRAFVCPRASAEVELFATTAETTADTDKTKVAKALP